MWKTEDKERVETILNRCMPNELDVENKINEMLE